MLEKSSNRNFWALEKSTELIVALFFFPPFSALPSVQCGTAPAGVPGTSSAQEVQNPGSR